MDVIEGLVITLVAVIVGILVVGFFLGWDYQKTYDDIKDMFQKKTVDTYEKVKTDELPKTVLEFKEFCSKRENNLSKTLYIESTGTLTQDLFFDYIKNASLCYTIESSSRGCGVRESFTNFPSITLPALVTIKCNKGNLSVVPP
jgi:hypothetical protein